jgi:hypothetical protein
VRRFVAGREFNRAFHDEVVRPLLGTTRYAAGLLGWGSDVLGYDTERSTDHGWGPRLCVFVDEPDVAEVAAVIDKGLPDHFRGYPVRFGWDEHETRHHVTVQPLGKWLENQIGVDATRQMTTLDWLLAPQQQLLGVVGGEVYADDGRLATVRQTLRWYPDQVWRWMLACQWRRLDQEEPFVQRTAEVGDELGSAVAAARQIREVMRLALLLGRRYAPYTKWLGTAFRTELDHRDGLDAVLQEASAATDLAGREYALCTAYELVAKRHNATGLTEPREPTVRQFHDRPALVLGAGRFVDALLDTVHDPRLARMPLTGAVDQITDNTDALGEAKLFRPFYETWLRSQP